MCLLEESQVFGPAFCGFGGVEVPLGLATLLDSLVLC